MTPIREVDQSDSLIVQQCKFLTKHYELRVGVLIYPYNGVLLILDTQTSGRLKGET